MPLDNWIILIAVLPLATAIFTTLLRGWISAQRVVGTLGLVATTALSAFFLWETAQRGPLATQMGDWPAPFGITVAFDELTGLLLLAANFVALACYIHAFSSLRRRTEARWFHPLAHLLMMGVNFSFLTGDLFNLFVAFEIMLMASYALLILGGSRRVMAHAHKYVMLNLVGSTLFVLGAGLVYGMMGTLNYADLARLAAEATAPGGPGLPVGFHAVSVMLLFVFALKAAIFPLWFWLPDTYPTCPIAIGALFSGLLTKVGVYGVCRLFPMVFAAPGFRSQSPTMDILWWGALATMLLPIVAATAMRQIRRVLALTLISHIGYLALGAAVMTATALQGVVFYMVQHMVVMAGLFLCCGLVERIGGTDDLRKLGGLQRKAPWLSAMFLLLSLSLAGVPPLSGFYGKLLIFREGFGEGFGLLVAAGLATSLLTLLALGRVWVMAFWSPAPGAPVVETPADTVIPEAPQGAQQRGVGWAYVGSFLLAGGAVAVALAAQPALESAQRATAELNHPKTYVERVLGPGAWPATAGVVAQADEQRHSGLPVEEKTTVEATP